MILIRPFNARQLFDGCPLEPREFCNGTSSSSPSSNSQNPCLETFVTSATKVMVQCTFDFLQMGLNN